MPFSNRPAPCTDPEKRMGTKKPVITARRATMFAFEKKKIENGKKGKKEVDGD